MLSIRFQVDSWEARLARPLDPCRGKNWKSCASKLRESIPCHCNIFSVAKGSLQWQWQRQSVEEFLRINSAFNVQTLSIDNITNSYKHTCISTYVYIFVIFLISFFLVFHLRHCFVSNSPLHSSYFSQLHVLE